MHCNRTYSGHLKHRAPGLSAEMRDGMGQSATWLDSTVQMFVYLERRALSRQAGTKPLLGQPLVSLGTRQLTRQDWLGCVAASQVTLQPGCQSSPRLQ